MSIYNQFRSWLFHQIHGKNLVYNTCWEDPRCDRKLLQINKDSKIVMITSAGCNALDYLLDDPQNIYCIDFNERQNALLDLKLALIKNTDYNTLFDFFGQGKHPNPKNIYEKHLRYAMPLESRKFWDKKLYYFNGKGLRKSFYYHGTAGLLAWFTMLYFKARKKLHQQVKGLMAATTIPQQATAYYQLEPQLLNPAISWLLNRHLVMCMAGVPRSQQELFIEKYDNGVMGFIEECFEQVFTKVPIKDNYFWKVYLEGAYTTGCCPEYLKKENFEDLKTKVDKIKNRSTSLSKFLVHNSGKYSHYVLLDHQDWLASNDIEELENEWRLILKNSHKGTKILLRSAAAEIDFFPAFVKEAVSFQKEEILNIHQEDRVGTYASVYLGTVE